MCGCQPVVVLDLTPVLTELAAIRGHLTALETRMTAVDNAEASSEGSAAPASDGE